MYFLKISLTAAFLAVLLFSPAVFAASRVVSITIENPDGPLKSSKAIFAIPFGLAPINLTEKMIWNVEARELTINLGPFASKEAKAVSFSVDGESGRYLLSGKILGVWPATALQPEENFQETIETFEVSIGEAITPGLGDFLSNLRSIPELTELADNVTKPAAVVLGGIGAGAILNSAFTASAEFAAGLSKFFSYIGFGFLRLKRRKPWGKVFNHLTGQPVEGAIVKVLDAQFKKVKETQITDSQGRFGFLVSPGEYFLKISKRGFAEKETPPIKVAGHNQVINIEAALEPLQSDVPAKSYRAIKMLRFWANALQKLSPWILALGVILSVFTAALAPSLLSYIVLGIYAALIILKIIFREVFFKSFGWILDKSTDKPVPLSVVRLFEKNKNWLLATRVTDQDGRFNFLIGPGDYYVTAAKEGYKPFQSAPTHFTKHGLISYDIKLEKQ